MLQQCLYLTTKFWETRKSRFDQICTDCYSKLKGNISPFIACLKFDHNGGYFGFGKRENFFSQRKFPIHYCALYIFHWWRENVVVVHKSLESAFCYIMCLRELFFVHWELNTGWVNCKTEGSRRGYSTRSTGRLQIGVRGSPSAYKSDCTRITFC